MIQHNLLIKQDQTPNLPGLSVGHIVAVHSTSVEEAPWLGKVTEVGDNKVEIIWMEGGWTKPWREMKVKKGRKMVEWRDRICNETVILYAIDLTKSNRLKAATVKYIP